MNPSSTSAVLFTYITFYDHELAALGLVVAHGFSLVAVSWGSSLVVGQASCHGGFSCCGARVLGCAGFRSGVQL